MTLDFWGPDGRGSGLDATTDASDAPIEDRADIRAPDLLSEDAGGADGAGGTETDSDSGRDSGLANGDAAGGDGGADAHDAIAIDAAIAADADVAC